VVGLGFELSATNELHIGAHQPEQVCAVELTPALLGHCDELEGYRKWFDAVACAFR
jgi:hypothetical protein